MLAFAVGNMAQAAAALNWITFIKALTASLLAKSWECHFPNPAYRFQDLTSPRTNVAFQFCKNDFIYCWKPLQHFRGKKKPNKLWLYLIPALVSPLVEHPSGRLVQRYCPRAGPRSCTAVSLRWPGHRQRGLHQRVWAGQGPRPRGCPGDALVLQSGWPIILSKEMDGANGSRPIANGRAVGDHCVGCKPLCPGLVPCKVGEWESHRFVTKDTTLFSIGNTWVRTVLLQFPIFFFVLVFPLVIF